MSRRGPNFDAYRFVTLYSAVCDLQQLKPEDVKNSVGNILDWLKPNQMEIAAAKRYWETRDEAPTSKCICPPEDPNCPVHKDLPLWQKVIWITAYGIVTLLAIVLMSYEKTH